MRSGESIPQPAPTDRGGDLPPEVKVESLVSEKDIGEKPEIQKLAETFLGNPELVENLPDEMVDRLFTLFFPLALESEMRTDFYEDPRFFSVADKMQEAESDNNFRRLRLRWAIDAALVQYGLKTYSPNIAVIKKAREEFRQSKKGILNLGRSGIESEEELVKVFEDLQRQIKEAEEELQFQTSNAEKVKNDAHLEAYRITNGANEKAEKITSDANDRSERMNKDANRSAERIAASLAEDLRKQREFREVLDRQVIIGENRIAEINALELKLLERVRERLEHSDVQRSDFEIQKELFYLEIGPLVQEVIDQMPKIGKGLEPKDLTSPAGKPVIILPSFLINHENYIGEEDDELKSLVAERQRLVHLKDFVFPKIRELASRLKEDLGSLRAQEIFKVIIDRFEVLGKFDIYEVDVKSSTSVEGILFTSLPRFQYNKVGFNASGKLDSYEEDPNQNYETIWEHGRHNNSRHVFNDDDLKRLFI